MFLRWFFGKKEPARPVSPSFSERLKNYKGAIPFYFCCPVTFGVMNEPIIINDHQNHTFDKVSLDKWLKTNPGIDPFRTPIVTQKPNTERIQQIEAFVSSFETIDRLQKQIDECESYSPETINLGADAQQIDEEQFDIFHEETKNENDKLLLQSKIELFVELQTFISLVQSAVQAEDKTQTEKEKEIEEITEKYREDLQILSEALKDIRPDLFPQATSTASEDISTSPGEDEGNHGNNPGPAEISQAPVTSLSLSILVYSPFLALVGTGAHPFLRPRTTYAHSLEQFSPLLFYTRNLPRAQSIQQTMEEISQQVPTPSSKSFIHN